MATKEITTKHKYLSYTQLYTFLNNPQEYYRRYILGIKPEPTEIMKYGSIFQDAWRDRTFNWKKELIQLNAKPSIISAMDKALKQMVRLPKRKTELTYTYPIIFDGILMPCILYAKLDGFDKEKLVIYENKFGTLWNEEKAKTDMQLTFYSFIIEKEFGKKPKIILQSADRKTGKVVIYETKRTKDDYDFLIENIHYAWENIVNGNFDKD